MGPPGLLLITTSCTLGGLRCVISFTMVWLCCCIWHRRPGLAVCLQCWPHRCCAVVMWLPSSSGFACSDCQAQKVDPLKSQDVGPMVRLHGCMEIGSRLEDTCSGLTRSMLGWGCWVLYMRCTSIGRSWIKLFQCSPTRLACRGSYFL